MGVGFWAGGALNMGQISWLAFKLKLHQTATFVTMSIQVHLSWDGWLQNSQFPVTIAGVSRNGKALYHGIVHREGWIAS
jgi:hypothetical protein